MDSMLNPHCLLLSEPTFGRAKKIRVWINGDIANKCFDITLNPNVLRTWNSVLQYLTHTIHPQFGAVRKLICLSSRKAVTCFEELDATEKYIAMGVNSKLIILRQGYTSASEQELLKPKKRRKKYYSGDMNSTNFQFLQDTKKRKLTVIYIVVNGQACQFPTKVVLNEKDLTNWNVSLQFLSKILDVPEGIQHICTIFGDIVMDPLQLQHGYLYVALPFNAKFEKIDYTNTFGRASNKSSYVLKIRKKAQPIRVCCPIMKERNNKTGKMACTKKKCLKESDDERECSVLLPQEIPESCRLQKTEDEDERMEEETEKNNDCCLPNDKMIHLWCKLKRYKPGCCDKHDLADVEKKEQVTKTRKKYSNAPLGQSNKKKSYANGGKNDFNAISPADLTAKDSTPTEETSENRTDQEKEGAFEKKSTPKQQKNKDNQILKPVQGNNQQYEVIDGKLSLDSIEDSSSNINSEVLDQEVPQKNDQIVTYFSRVDNVPTKDRKPLISTTISRAVQTVADFSQSYPLHHVTMSSACLSSPVDEEPTRLPANGGNENEDEDFAFIPIMEKYSTGIDSVMNNKCVNTGISMSKVKKHFLSEKNSAFSQFTADIPDQNRKSKMNRGISAILSELNVYPNYEPREMPSISIRNRTDINVTGYPKNGKRYRADDVKNCYESSSASESPSMPECDNMERNDNLCCSCRGARKLDCSISRICRSKQVSKRAGGSRERVYSGGHILEKASVNNNFDKNQKDSDNISTKLVSRNNSNSMKRDVLRSSKISEEGSDSNDHIDKNIIPERLNQPPVVDSNDNEVVPMPDIAEDQVNTVTQDSNRSKQSLASRKSRRTSTSRAESEQDFPKRKSSKRESVDQNVEKIAEDGPVIAQSLKEIPIGSVKPLDSKEPKQNSTRSSQENSARSSRRTSAISAVQKVMKTIDDNIPYYDDLENGNVENDVVSIDSKQRQEVSPRRKSSLRDSTSLSYSREKSTTSTSVEKNDPKSIAEEPQMKKCTTWRTGRQKGKCRLRNADKGNEDNVIPELDCEQSEESVLVRKANRSDSYNKAISSVKRILEESMAEINEVLLNKNEMDQNKTDKGSSNHLAETQQDQSYSSASDDSLAFFP